MTTLTPLRSPPINLSINSQEWQRWFTGDLPQAINALMGVVSPLNTPQAVGVYLAGPSSGGAAVPSFQQLKLASYTVAGLPAAPGDGAVAYATNGRKVGEGAGAGTGVPVYFSNTAWRVYSTDAAVVA